jgi:hypothetical protein
MKITTKANTRVKTIVSGQEFFIIANKDKNNRINGFTVNVRGKDKIVRVERNNYMQAWNKVIKLILQVK